MKERIVMAPGANGTELLRTLARFGVNTLGMRIVTGVELAKMALMKSGISITERFITGKEEPSVTFAFLNSVSYFSSASYADAENITMALHTLRGLISEEEEHDAIKTALENGEFQDKNTALIQVYEKYMESLKADKRIDGIGVMRKALKEANSFTGDFTVLKEFPCTPLEKALIDRISENKVKEISVIELFKSEIKKPESVSYTEGYGTVNEIEAILAEIYKNKYPLDSCLIVSANPSEYGQVLFDISGQRNIPVTYGSGIPIVNSNPAKLLKVIYNWDTKGYNGIDGLKEILLCEAFDRKALGELLAIEEITRRDIEDIYTMAGNLRISFDSVKNDKRISAYKPVLETELQNAKSEKSKIRIERNLTVLEWVQKLSNELSRGITNMLEKFTVLRQGAVERIDQAALNVIVQEIDAYERNIADGNPNDIIPDILRKTVCSENSREGHLHVSAINGAISSLRAHVYICGLSADEFPGSPSENYLVLDKDLLAFGTKDSVPTSENRIARKKEALHDVLHVAGSMNCEISLSYSGYNLATLKDQNPSSVLFSIYEELNDGKSMDDFKNELRHADYFKSEIGNTRLIGEAYSNGEALGFNPEKMDDISSSEALERAWSPSALEVFFDCPRHFYLSRILNIPEDEPDNPFEIINAADLGTLAHAMMEELADNPTLSKSDFLEKCGIGFDNFLLSRPPIHANAAKREKNGFLAMMDTAYELEPHNEVISAEDEYRFEHPSGVKLHGYPDRVEKDKAGNILIADFKTKRNIEHIKDNIASCLQVVIYAWLCEQAGNNVKSCEYRYLRKNKTVTCRYDEEMKEKLNEKLLIFKSAIETGNFPRNENNDSCKYCKMKDICLWDYDRREEEEDA